MCSVNYLSEGMCRSSFQTSDFLETLERQIKWDPGRQIQYNVMPLMHEAKPISSSYTFEIRFASRKKGICRFIFSAALSGASE